MSTSGVTGLGAAGLGWTVEAQLTGGAALEDHRRSRSSPAWRTARRSDSRHRMRVDSRTAERLQQAALEALDDYRDYGPADVP